MPHFGNNPIVGVEIGTGAGGGSAALLLLMPSIIKLYCIDAWQNFPGHGYEAEHYPQELHDTQYEMACARLAAYGDRPVILRMTSDQAVDHVTDNLDFVWIDGDHRYEQVKRDILNWMPKIRSGGIICGHDYIQAPGVSQAVDEIFGEVNTGDDFTWWRIL